MKDATELKSEALYDCTIALTSCTLPNTITSYIQRLSTLQSEMRKRPKRNVCFVPCKLDSLDGGTAPLMNLSSLVTHVATLFIAPDRRAF